MNTSLLDLIRALPGLTADEWRDHFARRRRMKCDDLGVPSDAEVDRQLKALCDAGLVECVDGRWEPVFERMPVGPVQGSLFG